MLPGRIARFIGKKLLDPNEILVLEEVKETLFRFTDASSTDQYTLPATLSCTKASIVSLSSTFTLGGNDVNIDILGADDETTTMLTLAWENRVLSKTDKVT